MSIVAEQQILGVVDFITWNATQKSAGNASSVKHGHDNSAVATEAILCATSPVSCEYTRSHGLPTSCAIEASVIPGESVCFLPNYSICLLIVLACEVGMLCNGSQKVARYHFCHCQHQPLPLS
jgi:hypothetical protein